MSKINFMMITASPEIACFVEEIGVARIFIDQETLGKQERQGHLNTHRAAHTSNDIRAVSRVLRRAELMVRVNPLNAASSREIDDAIEAGASRIMLPMFRSKAEVTAFQELVAERVPITLLAETIGALETITDWLPLLQVGRDEVHIGLNDLSLELKMRFLFEPLARGLIEKPAKILNETGVTWGLGGMARFGIGELPVEKVIGEHVRLGSNWAILSRAFHQEAKTIEELNSRLDFGLEVEKLREVESYWRDSSIQSLHENQHELAEISIKLSDSK